MEFTGWLDMPDEVAAMQPLLTMPDLKGNEPTYDPAKEVLLYKIFREIVGTDAPKGPQKIGDCVSWGWGNLINYAQATQIYQDLKAKGLIGSSYSILDREAAITARLQYQETATEVMYAFSRVEIGGQKGSYSDGSTGIWASRAATEKGSLSRPYLESKGLGGAYNPNRAKDWGAKGVPDNLEPDAFQHILKTTTPVRAAKDAIGQIQNGYCVAVCSNQGFTTTRDSQGFCKPDGVWNHCMLFIANRFDRPGLLCSQSWGPMMPNGPIALDQPDNTFWVDIDIVDRMLRQNDSYTGSVFQGYPDQDFADWHH